MLSRFSVLQFSGLHFVASSEIRASLGRSISRALLGSPNNTDTTVRFSYEGTILQFLKKDAVLKAVVYFINVSPKHVKMLVIA